MTRTSNKGILAIGFAFVMSLMSSTASAWVSSTSSSQLACKLPCSIEVDGILKGLGNVTNNPTAYAASILIEDGSIVFQNPAGNSSQANGVPFVNVTVNLTGSNLINAGQVSKNGTALSAIVFHDPELIQAIILELGAECDPNNPTSPTIDPNNPACVTWQQIESQASQHPNWLQRVVVTQMQVLGQQFVSGTPTNCDVQTSLAGCTPTDALGSECAAPNSVIANPQKNVSQGFNYACTVVCHDKTGSGYPMCPTSLPLP
jgi:hypothetical protein